MDAARIAELIDRVEPGARVTRAWALVGGISSDMTAVAVARADGSEAKFVIRSWDDVDVEYELLEALAARGLPVPRPRLLDGTCAVLDYVEGEARHAQADGAATAEAFAELLVAIHAIDGTAPEFARLGNRTDAVTGHLERPRTSVDDAVDEARLRETVRAHWPPPAPERVALLHGDLWPGNVLWQDDKVVAVIDWEDAGVGDPLTDVAVTRLDCVWTFGIEVSDAFTARYAELSGRSLATLPVWDLVAALRPAGQFSLWARDTAKVGRPDITADSMREGQRQFARRALAALR